MSKVLLMGMSLRKESFNKKMAANAHRLLAAKVGEDALELLSFNDFPMPVYNADEEEKAIPPGVAAFAAKIRDARALILSTPEYNGSIPGPFKNAIDWVSRVKPAAWGGKKLLLLGASPGALGAVRSLWHSRVPLEVLGVHVYPEMFGLPQAHLAFDPEGRLHDPATQEKMTALLVKFWDFVG